MAKKDPDIKEDIDRGEKKEQNISIKKDDAPNDIASSETEVKNASATGLGAMGRNDQENNEQATRKEEL